MDRAYISKSTFLRGMQCEKSMYLHRRHPDLGDQISEDQQAIFTQGTNVGILAQQLFPRGVDMRPRDNSAIGEAIWKTKEHIQSGEKVIYEAAFRCKNALAFVDILVKEERGWHIYEVKSSSRIDVVHVLDAAFQLNLLLNLGLDVCDVSIVHINTQYVRMGELDVRELFHIRSVFTEAAAYLPVVTDKISHFARVLGQETVPHIPIGTHCVYPYRCDFMGHCWRDVPDNSVFEIAGLSWDRKFQLYNQGVLYLKDVPDEYPLSLNQRLQVLCERSRETKIDRDRIGEFVRDLSYPLYFFDLETFNPAVPMFDNSRPYQQVPFQFSVHVKKSRQAMPIHLEFLAEAGPDPRPAFIKEFLERTESPGDIIVYNKAFETRILLELARDFPQYSDDLQNRMDRMKDLMAPFQSKAYYTPGMRGSHSIKAVLPELAPDLSYDSLPIGDGRAAMNAYERLFTETDPETVSRTRNTLLEYCKLDTYAMVRILEELEKV